MALENPGNLTCYFLQVILFDSVDVPMTALALPPDTMGQSRPAKKESCMSLMKKSDLAFTYSWSVVPPDSPRITGEPDSTLLNRHEGYEVMYLINKLAVTWELAQKSSGLKMERMIRDHLPSDIRSQANVKAWIQKNWKSYA